VKEIRRVADPEKKIRFFGLALEERNLDWISYFLDPKNHDPEVELDLITYHFYGHGDRMDPSSYEQFFPQADAFFPVAKTIFGIRDKLNPTVKIDMNEVGTILSDDNDPNAPVFPGIYWNAASSFFVYVWGNLVDMGLDVIGMSQLAGSPPIPAWKIYEAQYPSVSMMNWTTGEGTPRYWTLKVLLDTFRAGDKVVGVQNSNPDTIYAKGFVSGATKKRRLILVNKKYTTECVFVSSFFKKMTVIDETTLYTPPKNQPVQNGEVTLLPFAWVILE
jgi:hypothetical protein